MTTAHRPTWNAAVGSAEQGGSLRGVASRQTSKLDAPAYKKLQYRQAGQNAPGDVKERDFRAELELRERHAREKRQLEYGDEGESHKRLKLMPADGEVKEEEPRFHMEDKDDSDSSEDDSDGDSEESDGETAELMRELERIQKERQEEQAKQAAERSAADLEMRAESVLRGNPLLNPDKEDFVVRKKWYEDTVFRNQTRGAPEQKKPRFINDTIRNDFHRKFLNKYIK